VVPGHRLHTTERSTNCLVVSVPVSCVVRKGQVAVRHVPDPSSLHRNKVRPSVPVNVGVRQAHVALPLGQRTPLRPPLLLVGAHVEAVFAANRFGDDTSLRRTSSGDWLITRHRSAPGNPMIGHVSVMGLRPL